MAHLHDMEVDQHLADCVQIDELDLDSEFRRVAADLAYWSAQYAAAVVVWLTAKNKTKRIFAECWEEVRTNLLAQEAAGKVTEKRIESLVLSDVDYQAAQDSEVAAEGEKIRLHGLVDAVSIKKDALQSLGAKQRKEMEGDIRIMQREIAVRNRERGGDGLG